MKSRIYILCLILIATSSLGFDSSCGKKNSTNTTSQNSTQMPKSREERISDFRRNAAQYRHRIENGILRFIEFKRELKKSKKLNAKQDLALNETLTKLNDAVDNIGKLIAEIDITKLDSVNGILDEISSLSNEASNTILLFLPKESASSVKLTLESIQVGVAGLRLLLISAEKEFLNG